MLKRALTLLARSGLILAFLFTALPLATQAEGRADAIEPAGDHPETARLIARLLAHQHFRTMDIDDALSARVLDAYLEALDPDRYYFTQRDVEAFRAHADDLDDMLLDGDLAFPFAIHERLRARASERAEFARSVLADGLDFDTRATLDLDRRDEAWPADQQALDDLWRRRIKNDALTMLLADEDEAETMERLRDRYENVAENMARSDANDIFEAYMGAWARSFDPHTNYLSPRNSEEFDIQMQLSLEGIGAMLRTRRDYTEIVELVPGGPADQSGELSPGDRITGVAEGDGEMVDIVGWRLRDVVERIRGPKESTVRLRILPDGESDSARTVTLERNEIALEEQAAQRRTIEVERDGSAYRVGVITIPTFYTDFQAAQRNEDDYRSTTRDVRRHLEALQSDGVDGVIVDLRGNSGGSLQEAVDMTGLFLPKGPIVQIRRSNGDTKVMRDGDGATTYQGPMAVMVDRQSASASEIFAGAMQDYGRALILGNQTFGKGTVQTMVDLDRFSNDPTTESGRLKMTIAKFYRITGSSTQQRGVEPDIALPSAVDPEDIGESATDNALPWDEIDPVAFNRVDDLSDALGPLRERHETRSAANAAFAALRDRLALAREARNRTEVSLNRSAREARREERNRERLAAVNEHRELQGLEPLESVDELERDEEPDTLLDASAEIVADLVILREKPRVAADWGARSGD